VPRDYWKETQREQYLDNNSVLPKVDWKVLPMGDLWAVQRAHHWDEDSAHHWAHHLVPQLARHLDPHWVDLRVPSSADQKDFLSAHVTARSSAPHSEYEKVVRRVQSTVVQWDHSMELVMAEQTAHQRAAKMAHQTEHQMEHQWDNCWVEMMAELTAGPKVACWGDLKE
jgi:hypothetical protein